MKLTRLQKVDWFLGLTVATILAPVTRLLGALLRRDHQFRSNDTIVVMKLLGGGNFAMAMPMLVGIRKSFPNSKLIAVVTPATVEFAKAIGVFDSLRIIDTRSFVGLLSSAARTLKSIFRVDVVIDLEVYSKLSTCFGLFSCARNRLGFFTNDFFLREYLYTHLVFFNPRAPRPTLFGQFLKIIGATPVSHEECRAHLTRHLSVEARASSSIAIGVGCSDLGRVRQLNASQWLHVLSNEFAPDSKAELIFIGSRADWELAEKIAEGLKLSRPSLQIQNKCGLLTLPESLKLLGGCMHFYTIDSGLLHFARLLQVPTSSFWGPTDPATRLVPMAGYSETIHYKALLCSPCIHVAESPPCNGRNLCISSLFQNDPISEGDVLTNITIGPDKKLLRTAD
jgi:ADP-heptose:LPS heptosyltransferase